MVADSGISGTTIDLVTPPREPAATRARTERSVDLDVEDWFPAIGENPEEGLHAEDWFPATGENPEEGLHDDAAMRPGNEDPAGGARVQSEAVMSELRNVCLVSALRELGVAVPYTRSGPFRALADGNSMLRPFNYHLEAMPAGKPLPQGKYVAHASGHFVA